METLGHVDALLPKRAPWKCQPALHMSPLCNLHRWAQKYPEKKLRNSRSIDPGLTHIVPSYYDGIMITSRMVLVNQRAWTWSTKARQLVPSYFVQMWERDNHTNNDHGAEEFPNLFFNCITCIRSIEKKVCLFFFFWKGASYFFFLVQPSSHNTSTVLFSFIPWTSMLALCS